MSFPSAQHHFHVAAYSTPNESQVTELAKGLNQLAQGLANLERRLQQMEQDIRRLRS